MTDPEHPDPLTFLLDGADDSVVADPIPPEPRLVAAKRFAELVRIILTRETLSQVAEDSSLDQIVEARQFFESGGI